MHPATVSVLSEKVSNNSSITCDPETIMSDSVASRHAKHGDKSVSRNAPHKAVHSKMMSQTVVSSKCGEGIASTSALSPSVYLPALNSVSCEIIPDQQTSSIGLKPSKEVSRPRLASAPKCKGGKLYRSLLTGNYVSQPANRSLPVDTDCKDSMNVVCTDAFVKTRAGHLQWIIEGKKTEQRSQPIVKTEMTVERQQLNVDHSLKQQVTECGGSDSGYNLPVENPPDMKNLQKLQTPVNHGSDTKIAADECLKQNNSCTETHDSLMVGNVPYGSRILECSLPSSTSNTGGSNQELYMNIDFQRFWSKKLVGIRKLPAEFTEEIGRTRPSSLTASNQRGAIIPPPVAVINIEPVDYQAKGSNVTEVCPESSCKEVKTCIVSDQILFETNTEIADIKRNSMSSPIIIEPETSAACFVETKSTEQRDPTISSSNEETHASKRNYIKANVLPEKKLYRSLLTGAIKTLPTETTDSVADAVAPLTESRDALISSHPQVIATMLELKRNKRLNSSVKKVTYVSKSEESQQLTAAFTFHLSDDNVRFGDISGIKYVDVRKLNSKPPKEFEKTNSIDDKFEIAVDGDLLAGKCLPGNSVPVSVNNNKASSLNRNITNTVVATEIVGASLEGSDKRKSSSPHAKDGTSKLETICQNLWKRQDKGVAIASSVTKKAEGCQLLDSLTAPNAKTFQQKVGQRKIIQGQVVMKRVMDCDHAFHDGQNAQRPTAGHASRHFQKSNARQNVGAAKLLKSVPYDAENVSRYAADEKPVDLRVKKRKVCYKEGLPFTSNMTPK